MVMASTPAVPASPRHELRWQTMTVVPMTSATVVAAAIEMTMTCKQEFCLEPDLTDPQVKKRLECSLTLE